MDQSGAKLHFSDEKKFKFEEQDDLMCCRHDVRLEPEYFSTRFQGGGLLTVWKTTAFNNASSLMDIKSTMEANYCCNVLK